jgi:hypothetical protein
MIEDRQTNQPLMLRSIKQLSGNKLGAADGDIGHVKDFYFDDRNWAVRYVVADTGSWLPGRQVLISPRAFRRLLQLEKILRVKLTKKQIEGCPAIDSHKPVSRQYEEEYHRFYGWPFYWQGDALWGMSGVPLTELPIRAQTGEPHAGNAAVKVADANLRSTEAVTGYTIQATDGVTGHICDFLMDSQTWQIRELVVKTGHRFSGKEVQVPTDKVSRINYEESTIFVNMTKEAIESNCADRSTPVETSL